MSEFALTPARRRRLQQQLKYTQDARVYRRTLAILQVDQGIPINQVAHLLGVTRQSIYNWIDDYCQDHDPAALADAQRIGRPRFWTEDLQGQLQNLLGQSPEQLGYPAVNWTIPLLREQLGRSTGQWPSEDTLRRQLHRLDYVWKRPRYVLDPDPELEKKKALAQANQAVAAPDGLVG
jgi:transposase